MAAFVLVNSVVLDAYVHREKPFIFEDVNFAYPLNCTAQIIMTLYISEETKNIYYCFKSVIKIMMLYQVTTKYFVENYSIIIIKLKLYYAFQQLTFLRCSITLFCYTESKKN